MKRFLFFICFLLSCTLLLAQNAQYAYEVHFTDKGNTPYSLSDPGGYLSARSITRRNKYNITIDSTDLPVNTTYTDSILAKTDGILHLTSKWLNLCIILVNDTNDVLSLDTLSFVSGYKRVGYYPFGLHQRPQTGQDQVLDDLDTNFYAAAWTQIHLCHGEYLHQQGYMGEGMLIAVIDVGFENASNISFYDSLRQQDRVLDTFNFKQHNGDVFSSGIHGTKILSCMAAYAPESFVGTAPKAMYALYATDDETTENSIEMDNWLAAAERADSIGADIITTSLGYNTFDDNANSLTYEQLDGKTTIAAKAANMATQKGILVLTSAGNEGMTSWHYMLTPGDADSALTVGAVNSSKEVASSSSYGPNAAGVLKPDVCAHGVATASISPEGEIVTGSGASYATPIMAGLAACLMQAFPNKTPFEIRQLIRSVSDHYTSPDEHIGYGVPDFEMALQPSAVDNIHPEGNYTVYPNPANSTLNITFNQSPAGPLQITIADISGRILMKENRNGIISGVPVIMNVSKLSSGTYFLKIYDGTTAREVKLVKL